MRDSRGEPHVQGASARGAMYGFAWAQMQDQAPYILATMARSVGRSAELIGPDCRPNPQADPNLQACFRQDQLARLFLVPEMASIGWRGLPASDRDRLQGFADGINAYIDSGAANVPSWAVKVTPQDVLANVEYGFEMSQVGAAVRHPRQRGRDGRERGCRACGADGHERRAAPRRDPPRTCSPCAGQRRPAASRSSRATRICPSTATCAGTRPSSPIPARASRESPSGGCPGSRSAATATSHGRAPPTTTPSTSRTPTPSCKTRPTATSTTTTAPTATWASAGSSCA